jgi:hypothetical protein
MKAVDIVQGRRRSRTELYRGLARKGLTLRQLIVEQVQGLAASCASTSACPSRADR